MNTIKNEAYLAEMTRLTSARADKEELKVQLLRGEVIERKAVDSEWAEQVARVRTKLLALPVRLAGLLGGKELSSSDVEGITRELVNEALTELAESFSVEDEPDAES